MDAELVPYGGCCMLNWHVGFRGCQLTPIDEVMIDPSLTLIGDQHCPC